MTNPPKKSDREKQAATDQTSGSGSANVLERFKKAYQDYVTALNEIHMGGRKRCIDAYKNYGTGVQATWVDTNKRLADAHNQYAMAIQDAWGQEDAQKLGLEAHRVYVRTLREVGDEARKRYEEANDAHSTPLQDINADMKRDWTRAYQDYVAAIKEAWTTADTGAIDVNTLACISHSTAAAASFASYTADLGSHTKNY